MGERNEMLSLIKTYVSLFENRNIEDHKILSWIDQAVTKYKTLRDKQK